MDISVGDTVEVVCIDRSRFDQDPTAKKVFHGVIISIFNALDSNGDNWEYEIKSSTGEWFLYKPSLDEGSITKLQS